MKRISLRAEHLLLVVVGIQLVLLAAYLTGRSASEPYYSQEVFIYPLLVLFHSKLFQIAMFGVLVLFGILAWIKTKRKLIRALAAGVVFLTCGLSAAVTWQTMFFPDFVTRNAIDFENYRYFLAVSSGYVLGHDCDLTAYVVYRCDAVGILCQTHNVPYLDSYTETECAGNLSASEDTSFFIDIDEDKLYVTIAAENYLIAEGTK